MMKLKRFSRIRLLNSREVLIPVLRHLVILHPS